MVDGLLIKDGRALCQPLVLLLAVAHHRDCRLRAELWAHEWVVVVVGTEVQAGVVLVVAAVVVGTVVDAAQVAAAAVGAYHLPLVLQLGVRHHVGDIVAVVAQAVEAAGNEVLADAAQDQVGVRCLHCRLCYRHRAALLAHHV